MKLDLRRIQPVRSLILFAAGALCGVAVVHAGLLSWHGPVGHRVPPEDAALVNERPILRADFIARTEAAIGKTFAEASAAERARVLGGMIREELLVQRALELGVPGSDPETREHLVEAVERRAVATAMAQLPSDAQLERYYQDHRASYASEGAMTLHNLLLPNGAISAAMAMPTARKAVEALRGGASLSEVLAKFGLHDLVPEHAALEQFYFSQRVHLGDALFATALRLEAGEVSEPVVAADGIHILQMLNNTRPVPRPFDRVRPQVLNDYVAAEKRRLEDAEVRALRDKADVLIADDLQ